VSVLAFPDIGVRAVTLLPDYKSTVVETVGGDDHVSVWGFPKWLLTVDTRKLNRAEYQVFSAFWNKLKGGLNSFTVSNPERPFPINYPGGFDGMVKAVGGAFDGTATANAIAANSITIQGLPADFALKAGDPLGLVEGGKFGYFELADDATANASGIVTVVPEPFIPTNVFSTSAQANFAKALVEMRARPESLRAPRQRARMPVSFTAKQVGY
jgi:hypothetical protein